MPDAVEGVEDEGEGEQRLGGDLCGQRPGGEGGSDGLGLEVPAGERGDGVGGEEDVEAARQQRAGDTVERRGVPGDLRLVDAQVGGDGAAQALLLEDGVGLGGGQVLGRDGPGGLHDGWLARDKGAWRTGEAKHWDGDRARRVVVVPRLHQDPGGCSNAAVTDGTAQGVLEGALGKHDGGRRTGWTARWSGGRGALASRARGRDGARPSGVVLMGDDGMADAAAGQAAMRDLNASQPRISSQSRTC